MKLKTKLSKLRHDGHITDAEYSIIINALNHQKPKERVIAEIKIDEDTLRKLVKDKVDELTTKFATQPCEDAISRQAAINAIKTIHPVDTEYDCTLYDKLDVMYVLKDLPPVTLQAEPCEDAISRQAIYEALSEWDEQDVYLPYHFKELVAELPPVTPTVSKMEQVEDCIRRSDVLALAEKGVLVSNDNYQAVCKAINELPPVIPKGESESDD